MPKRYYFAIPVLAAVCISMAHAEQKGIPTAATAKTGAKKAPGPAIAASAPVATTETVAASAPAAAAAVAPAPAEATALVIPAPAVVKSGTDKAVGSATAATDLPKYKFGGYGTLGASHSSMDQGDYVLDSSMPKGPGRSGSLSPSNNIRVAAHLTADFTPAVSAIFQVDSEYRPDGTYRPEIEWLNVKYAINPNAYMRVGRIALPTFIDSENHDIGYSYVWVNPPVDLYHQLSIPSSDGVDFMYRSEIGEAGNTIKAIYGTNIEKSPNRITTSKDMWGVFDTFEYGPAIFHLSYQQRRSSSQSTLTGITGSWTRNSDISVGASYDPGNWFVISEWMQRRSTTKINAMYVSGGYRVDKFTPYLLYSQNSPGSFISDLPAPSAAAIDRAKRSQHTTSLGVRWDFMRNYDFKVQYDQVKLGDNSNGYLVNVPAGVKLWGSKFIVISAVVDFVF